MEAHYSLLLFFSLLLGEVIGTNISIQAQMFGDVHHIQLGKEEAPYGNPDVSGVAAFLYQSDDQYSDISLVTNIFNALGVTDRKFTVWLGPHKPPSQNFSEAALSFGGLDKTHCSSVVNFEFFDDIPNFTVYQVVSGTFSSDTDGMSAYVDTGLPTIAFHSEIYRALFQQINPDYDWDLGLLTTPCSANASLPSWVFSLSGADYSVPPSNYVVDLDIDGGETCAVALEVLQDGWLYADIVLGNPFVRSACVVYDLDNDAIGFANVLA
ncbi:Peptidase A1 domain-containing protein [Aphelenchoides fujianensis]|nr:Peptidase A1 domain-containing protein [Aphelenchoides fujianensis]